MVLEVEPLADAELGPIVRKVLQGELWGTVLLDQAHIEVAVVGRALGLAVPGRGWPGLGQVVQPVPVDARSAQERLGGPLQPELLDLLGTEGRDSHLRHPDGQVGERLDLGQPIRPLIDLPVVPVEGEGLSRRGPTACPDHEATGGASPKSGSEEAALRRPTSRWQRVSTSRVIPGRRPGSAAR